VQSGIPSPSPLPPLSLPSSLCAGVTNYDESFRGVGAGGAAASTTVAGGATVPSRDTISAKLPVVAPPASVRLATSPITIPTRRSAAPPAAATGAGAGATRGEEPGFRSSATLSRAGAGGGGSGGGGSPGKKRVVTTAYNDLDGPGANPYELMKQLGFTVPTGSTRRSGGGAAGGEKK